MFRAVIFNPQRQISAIRHAATVFRQSNNADINNFFLVIDFNIIQSDIAILPGTRQTPEPYFKFLPEITQIDFGTLPITPLIAANRINIIMPYTVIHINVQTAHNITGCRIIAQHLIPKLQIRNFQLAYVKDRTVQISSHIIKRITRLDIHIPSVAARMVPRRSCVVSRRSSPVHPPVNVFTSVIQPAVSQFPRFADCKLRKGFFVRIFSNNFGSVNFHIINRIVFIILITAEQLIYGHIIIHGIGKIQFLFQLMQYCFTWIYSLP